MALLPKSSRALRSVVTVPSRHPDGAGDIVLLYNSPNRRDQSLRIDGRGAVLRQVTEFGFELGVAHRPCHGPTRLRDVALEPAAVHCLYADKCRLDRNIRILLNCDVTAKIENRRLSHALILVLRETGGAVKERDRNAVLDAYFGFTPTRHVRPVRPHPHQGVSSDRHPGNPLGGERGPLAQFE